nr:MBL fold metallo-hydrolase [uncultured Anaeromusa sp.]
MSRIIPLKLGFADAHLVLDQQAILIDTGINANQEQYLSLFSQAGLTPQDITLLVITHGHADHYGNIRMLKDLTGAPVLCHLQAAQALQTAIDEDIIPCKGLGESVWEQIKNHLPQAASTITPDLLAGESFDLTPYGVAGKTIHTPGHTPGSLSVLLDSGEAIVGDLIVKPPFSPAPSLAYFANDEAALQRSINRLLQEAHTFFGGHGGPFQKKDILPLLSKQNYRSS